MTAADGLRDVRRSGLAEKLSSQARRWLPVLVVLLLPMAWWLSLILIADTNALDLTPPKVLALVALAAMLAARPSIAIPRVDLMLLGLAAAYCTWLIVAAGARGSGADLKMTLGYAIYFGGPLLAGYVAGRQEPRRLSRVLIAVVAVALAVTMAGAILERFTYPGAGRPDPLAGMWAFVRPQTAMEDAVRGTLVGPPLHFPSGDPAVPRVSSWFAHANYLAFFGVLTAAFAATTLVTALQRARRSWAAAAAAGLVASSIIVIWTYSRVGLVGLLGVVAAVVVVRALTRRAPGEDARRRLSWVAPAVIVLLSAGLVLAGDQVGLRRFSTTVEPPAPVGAAGGQGEDIEASATRSSAIRVWMQAAAVALISESARTFVLGPGQATYERAIHDKASPLYTADAAGFRDPNSLWLTLGLAGGVPAVALMAALLSGLGLRLVSVLRTRSRGMPGLVIASVLAWLPVWSVVQFFGTFPFVASEAIILGALLGSAIGVASGVDGHAEMEPLGSVRQREG